MTGVCLPYYSIVCWIHSPSFLDCYIMNRFLKPLYLLLLLTFLGVNIALAEDFRGKKILYVDSYHLDYPWSAGIQQGIKNVLKHTHIELKTVSMDTKRHRSEMYKKEVALKVKKVIENYQPDVVIASDDNASKHLIQPYYKNADLPFVFCGVNWDASTYDYPYKNTTGMVEVSLIKPLVKQLETYSKGLRLGVLAFDTFSERKAVANYRGVVVVNEERYVSTFEEWKQAYIDLQKKVDQLVLVNITGAENWNDEQAIEFVKQNTTIPTGALERWVMPFAMLGYVKIPEEQGEWAANAALKILKGRPPRSIPIVTNEKGKLMINLGISEKANILFSLAMLKTAEIFVQK